MENLNDLVLPRIGRSRYLVHFFRYVLSPPTTIIFLHRLLPSFAYQTKMHNDCVSFVFIWQSAWGGYVFAFVICSKCLRKLKIPNEEVFFCLVCINNNSQVLNFSAFRNKKKKTEYSEAEAERSRTRDKFAVRRYFCCQSFYCRLNIVLRKRHMNSLSVDS